MSQNTQEKLSFVQSQVRFICRNALGIVIVIAVMTAALMPAVQNLKLHANFLELLPKKHPSVVNLHKLLSHTGGTSFLIVVIESPDEATARIAAEKFSEKAASLKNVEYVDNRTNVPAFQNRKLLFLNLQSVQKLKKNIRDVIGYYRRQNNPFYMDLVTEKKPTVDTSSLELEEKVYKIGSFSAKEKNSYMQVVLLKPSYTVGDFVRSKTLFDDARAAFSDVKKELKYSATMGLTGPYKTRYDEYYTITHDLKWTGILATILLVLINLVAFRNFRSLIYAYLPLAVGILWTWAFTDLTIGYLNLITAFLAAILFGMGGDYTFHILVSFEEDLRLTGNVEKAIELTYRELWNPLWSSMWTTAVVFYAMIVSQFEGFRHFGIIAGVGIVISFLVVLYLQPSLIVLGEKYFPAKRKPVSKSWPVSRTGIYAVIIAGIIFSIFSVTRISHMKFNYDFRDLQAKDADAIQFNERIGNYFGVHLNPVVFMTPNRERATSLAVEINRHIHAHPESYMDFAAAITSHVPQHQEEKIKVLGEIGDIIEKRRPLLDKLDAGTRNQIAKLEEQLKPRSFGFEELPQGLVGQYEGKDGQISGVFVYPAHRILDGQNAKRFVKEARGLNLPKDVILAGEPVIYADILNLMERDTPIAIGLSTIVVFLLVLFHFKRIDHVLWVHAPLAIGGLWMVGLMALAHLKLNFFNMVIIPSILGVGIDNGIYIFDRYKERKRENFFKSMRKSIKGVILSSATNLAAFASLMCASHQGMASLGKLGFIGFTACLISSVFFVPALIEFFELKYSHLFKK
ncbi:MAG: hypothetical protein EXS63_06930 [Candidatus Omnitrophica bacterium]|nr:hypothetical protein [Candidatus Omnitrophota bacterium]